MTHPFGDIEKWASEGEGPVLEFKEGVGGRVGITIAAFANTFGGIIVIGISPEGKLVGLKNADKASKEVRELIDRCKPTPIIRQEFARHGGNTYIILEIEQFSYSREPCFFDKKCFVRQGTTNLELYGQDLIDFLRKRVVLNFEEQRTHATLRDIDIQRLSKLLVRREVEKPDDEEALKRVLTGLRVANYNGEFFLKNVALLFFAKEAERFFQNLQVRMVRYKGKEPVLGSISLETRISDTMPELIEDTYKTAMENIPSQFTLVGAERKSVPEYPENALREVITNAIGHRDYFDTNPILIEIFEDRMQIKNPGGLLQGQTLKNLDKMPRHRNPICYRLLQDLGFGEGLGLGIPLIRRQFRAAGLPDPEFYDGGSYFQVTFYNKGSGKRIRAVAFENMRQKQALVRLKKNTKMKAADYARLVAVSIPTAINDLNELIKQGKIKRVGRYRGAYYILSDETLQIL